MEIVSIQGNIPEDNGAHKSSVLVGYDPQTHKFYPVAVDSEGRISVDTEITVSGTFIIDKMDISKWGGVSVSGFPLTEDTFLAEDFAQETTLSGLVETVRDYVANTGKYTTPAHTEVVLSGASTPILAENIDRKYALFINDSANVMYLAFGEAASMNRGVRLNANGCSYEMSIKVGNMYTGEVYGITLASGVLLVTEGG